MRKFNLPLKTLVLLLVITLPLVLPSGNQKDFFENAALFPRRAFFNANIKAESLKTEPLDFLFLGGSIIENSIQAKIIEDHLSRPEKSFRVYSASHGAGGADAYTQYRLLEHFLKNRKVKTVFLSAEALTTPPGIITALDFDKELLYPALQKMTKDDLASLAGMAILSSPRRIRQWLFPIRPMVTKFANRMAVEHNLQRGSLLRYEGFEHQPFVMRSYKVPNLNIDTLLSMPDSSHDFFNTDSFESYFLNEIVRLSRLYRVRLFIINSPQFYAGLPSQGNRNFPVPVIEAPTKDLFNGLNREEIRGLFRNSTHLNSLGGKLHTEALLPLFKKISEDSL